jgi:ribosomal protein L7/L12
MTFTELVLVVIVLAAIVSIITVFLNRRALTNVESDEDVIRLLNQGERRLAIKAYRQLHGVGLKSARRFVDSCQDTAKEGK